MLSMAKCLLMKRPACLFLLLLLSVTCFAQDGISTKIDDYIRTEMQTQQIPGVSLAVIKNGEIVLARGYGLANVEHQVAVKPETIFQSGSVGKQFTAMAVMMLVGEGKVGLDDPITKYFDGAPESWKAIKVRNLLSHTSGIPDYEGAGMVDLHREYSEADL